MSLLIFMLLISYSNAIGFSNQIIIGSARYVIGNNINQEQYSDSKIYNIPDLNNEVETYEIFQRALIELGIDGGGILNIKSGIYIFPKYLEIYESNIQIKGDGIDNTILKLSDYAPSFITGTKKRSGFIRAKSIESFIVSDMTLDGNKNNQYNDDEHKYGRYGLFTEGCDNVWFDKVKIINFQGYGFDPHGWKTAGIWGNYLTISDCIANDNGYDGFTLDQTLNIYVSNCYANSNARHGFNIVTDSKYVSIANSKAINNGFNDPFGGSGCGLMIQNNGNLGTNNVSVYNNDFVGNKKAAICINNVADNKIYNNEMDNEAYCYHLVKVSSTNIYNNDCVARRHYSSTDTTIINEPGTGSATYLYNNLYSSISPITTTTGQTTTESVENYCNYGDMKCVASELYQTCIRDRDGKTNWGPNQSCNIGLTCRQTGNVIYCY